MKKILLPIALLLLLFMSLNVVMADTATTTSNSIVVLENPVGASDIWAIVNRIINLLFTVSLYAGLVLIIWAGWVMITSQGDTKKTAQAVKIITSVLIGIVIILLARFIISAVYYVVTGKPGGVPDLNTTNTTHLYLQDKII